MKYLSLFALFVANFACAGDIYTKIITDNKVLFERNDARGYISLEIMPPVSFVNTTKDYAIYVMESLKGFDLKAQVSLRSFSFKFVDNAPCSGVVSYFDGSNYLFYRSCGANSKQDLDAKLYEAQEDLKLKEHLKNLSRPQFY